MTPLRQQFKKYWDAGLTYAEMAKLLGVTERCLYNLRVELGLPRRGWGRRKL